MYQYTINIPWNNKRNTIKISFCLHSKPILKYAIKSCLPTDIKYAIYCITIFAYCNNGIVLYRSVD